MRDPYLRNVGNARNTLLTLISSCVINRRLLNAVDAMDFRGGNLVQVHLVLRAALAASKNLLMDRYLIACKRTNSGGYDFPKVFVTNLGGILDSHAAQGLSTHAIRQYETRITARAHRPVGTR